MPRLVGNSGSSGLPARSCQPDAQHRDGLRGQRGDAFFAALAVAVRCGPLPSVTSRAGQARSARRRAARSGSASAAARGRGGRSRCSRSGAASSASISSSVRNVTIVCGRRVWAGSPARARSCRRARGAGARRSGTASGSRPAGRCGCAVLLRALVLEVVEERADQLGVEVGESSRLGGLPVCCCGEREQQPERVAVGGDRVRAGLALADQPLGEERLQGRGERAHDRASAGRGGARRRARAARARPAGTSRSRPGGGGPARPTAAAAARRRRRRRGASRAACCTAKLWRRSCMRGPAAAERGRRPATRRSSRERRRCTHS